MLQVTKPDGTNVTMHAAFVGVKGDWPWQRTMATYVHMCCICWTIMICSSGKCHRLVTGFNSRRVCHYCGSQAGSGGIWHAFMVAGLDAGMVATVVACALEGKQAWAITYRWVCPVCGPWPGCFGFAPRPDAYMASRCRTTLHRKHGGASS